MTNWQVKIINTRTGGVMICGVAGVSRSDAFRRLAYLPSAGRHLVIASIVAIPPKSER